MELDSRQLGTIVSASCSEQGRWEAWRATGGAGASQAPLLRAELLVDSPPNRLLAALQPSQARPHTKTPISPKTSSASSNYYGLLWGREICWPAGIDEQTKLWSDMLLIIANCLNVSSLLVQKFQKASR